MVRKPLTPPALTKLKPGNTMNRSNDMSLAKQRAPLSPENKTPSQPPPRKEIVFIDQGVDDYPTLIAGVKAGIDIHLIDPTQDGVLQITAILKHQTNLSAVHIVSHGTIGYLALGNSVLSTATLDNYKHALFSWQIALEQNADILIYGCEVAKGEIGQSFIARLATITGANIAAANNLIGNVEKNGYWELAFCIGNMKTSIAFNDAIKSTFTDTLATVVENFNTNPNFPGDYASSFALNGFTYTFTSDGDGGDFTWEFNLGVGSSGAMKPDSGASAIPDNLATTERYTIEKTDRSLFVFNSIDLWLGSQNVTVTGKLNGNTVGSVTLTANNSTFQTASFISATVVDIIEITSVNFNISTSDVFDNFSYDLTLPNTPPSISINNTALAYTENALATQIDTAATLTDADGDADWNGGTLTVQITANNEAADRLSIVDNAVGSINTSGTNLLNGAIVIGTLSTAEGTVINGTALTITFNANATNALVQQVIQAVHFDNISDDPGTENRTITFTATDKHGAAASDTRTIAITSVNDAPTLTATATTPTFTESGSAVSLFSSTSISAVESGDGINQLVLTVTNVTDGNSEALFIDGSDVNLTHGNSVATATNAMTASVTITGSTATVTVTKAGGITTSQAQTLVNAITYTNVSQDPTAANHVITLTSIKDSGGTANGGVDTTALAIAATVTVVPVNDAPTLTASGSNPTFTQGGSAVDLFSGITASAVESGQTLEQLMITVTNVTDGAGTNEFLSIGGGNVNLSNGNSGTISSSIDYSVSLVAGTATITLTKAGMSAAEVQTLIDGLTYSNTSTSPSSANRVVTITSLKDNGGTANGGVDTATLSITSSVTVVPSPLIDSATYNATTGTLVVTGANIQANSGGADIDVSKLTFTGEGGDTYTLTDSADVERDSSTQFTVTLSATDKAALNQIINRNGLVSTSGTTYNLAAADDWNTPVTTGDTADTTGNGITVSNVAAPTITSASYDASTGVLAVTGTNFLKRSGAANDIDVSMLTFTGEGGTTYTLTDTADVKITSGTAFTVTLGAIDKAALNQIINKNGTSSTGGTTYNLAAAEDWAVGADAAVTVADLTGNGITVSNVAIPTITSASYDANTGLLLVTGTNFLKRSGAANDIDVSMLTFTGEGGTTYTLTDTVDVEISSSTTFTVTLGATDKAALNQIINKNGTSSTGGTTYNLAAAEDWAVGADAAVTVADPAGNGITISNVVIPTITSAIYDASTGSLVVTGTNFLKRSGAANDIDVSKLTFTGEGGETYSLAHSSDVEITSGTAFTVTLGATDKAALNQIINKNGTSSTGGTTYNLAAAEDWAAGADAAVIVADLTGNGITVSNVAIPTITSATYDASSGTLVVAGTDFLKANGAANDIDISKLTFTGEGGETYSLAHSSDVEITSGTAFTVTLGATDKAALNQIINKNGTSSTGGTTYNLAAAEDWAAGADAAVIVADLTGNGITVSNVAIPTITSATYDASTGVLVVTGTDFLKASGAANDIIANKLSFSGQGGTTYTLTDTANVEITSGISFTVTLSATDKAGVNLIINRSGTTSADATLYNLAAAEDWAAGVDAAVNVADTIGIGITVSNVAAPSITSSIYDANTGILIVTGTNIEANIHGADIDVSKLTFMGEGGDTHALTDSTDVERDSSTQFTITLSATDKASVNQILNKNGLISTGGTIYNLVAEDDWNTNVIDDDTSDTTGNGITVSNVAVPTITSSTYYAGTGVLIVTGTGFLKYAGAANDIDASKFTFTGEGGATYTLSDSANVEISSGTTFTIILSAADKATVNQIINKAGIASTDSTPYNLAAEEDWAVGADTAIDVADVIGNGITAIIPSHSSKDGGNTPIPGSGGTPKPTPPSSPPLPTTKIIDGVIVTTTIQSDGAVSFTIPIVNSSRQDNPTSLFKNHADIPLVTNSQGNSILTVSIPVDVGFSAEGQLQALSKQTAAHDLSQRIEQKSIANTEQRQAMISHGQDFLDSLTIDELVYIHALELMAGNDQKLNAPIIITGPDGLTESKQLLIIDASNLPANAVLQLDNVAFAVIIGAVHVVGGKGNNYVTSDLHEQVVILGAGDDILYAGAGDDTVGSLGGDDYVSGDAGNDIVYGGTGNDTLSGGTGDDRLNGGLGFDVAMQAGQRTDYQIDIHDHEVILTLNNGEVDILTDIELVRFDKGPSLTIAHSATEAVAHHLVKTWLERDLTAVEGNAVQNWHPPHVDEIVAAFRSLPEAIDLHDKTNSELLTGLDNNPNIIQLDVAREFIGTAANDHGYLPLGLALTADGGMGHDVLHMHGNRNDVHLEFVGDALELTRLSDGAMLSLQNVEAIAFDSGDTVILAHNVTEGILGRLFHTFLGRDATSAEWQLGREALVAQINPESILDWFRERAALDSLSNTDYIQTIFTQTLGRQAIENELTGQLLRLENEQIDRQWLAVEIAQSAEAEINLIGNVMLHEGWI